MNQVINLLEKELIRLNHQVQYESNRQVGNDLDDQIVQVKKAIKILNNDNCPDLTAIWNEAVFKQERGEITPFEVNDCWGALRLLEKHKLCKLF